MKIEIGFTFGFLQTIQFSRIKCEGCIVTHVCLHWSVRNYWFWKRISMVVPLDDADIIGCQLLQHYS